MDTGTVDKPRVRFKRVESDVDKPASGAGGASGTVEGVDPAAAIAEPAEPARGGSGGSGGSFDINGDGPAYTPEAPAPRKRGRPKGSTNAKVAIDISGIEKILLSLHAMASASLETPELLLDDAEAKQMATAIKEVGAHYAVTIDPKTLAWLNLGMAFSMVYGTRVVAIYSRKKKERATPAPIPNAVDKVESGPGDASEVFPFRQPTMQ